jgi:hypothetical protein
LGEFFLLELLDIVEVVEHLVAQLSLQCGLEEGEVDEGLLFSVHVSVAVVLFVVFGFVVQGDQVVAVGQRAFVAVLQFEHLGLDFGADVGDLFVAWVRGGVLSLSRVSSC